LQEGEPIIDLKTEKSLQEIGGAVKLRFAKVNDGSVILVIRTSQTEFATYAAQCMHWGAEVGYPKDGIIECPLHGSRYKTTNGSVVNGPASKPLTMFKTTFDETHQQVIITENLQ
jgi:Rieske Fe-S protein